MRDVLSHSLRHAVPDVVPDVGRDVGCPSLPALVRALALACVVTIAATAAAAPPASLPKQDLGALRAQAGEFLLAHAATLPGKASVSVGEPDTRLQLTACAAPQFSLAPGARAFGKTSVIARCGAPVAWSVYLKATVTLITPYVSSAVALAQGQQPVESDLVMKEADLAALPAGVLTDLAQARQRSLRVPVAAGMPLTGAMLRREPVVQPGQVVRLLAQGTGFAISAEGRALTGGAEGERVRARTAGGQIVSGTAQADGVLALHY